MDEEATRGGRAGIAAPEASGGVRSSIGVFTAALMLTTGLALGCDVQEPAPSLTPEREAALADTLLSVTEDVEAAWKELEPGPYLAHYGDDVRDDLLSGPVHGAA